MDTITVSIIIVHYNSDTYTTECLKSLEKIDQKGLNIKVILVDNASDTRYSYTSNHFPIHIIRSEKNTGFSGGNNIGISYTLEHDHPEYVLLLNSDTTIEPRFLKTLVAFAHTHQNVGTVSPKIYFEKGYEFHKVYTEKEKGKVIWFAGGSIDWKDVYAFHRAVDEVDRGQTDLPAKKRSSDEMPYYGYQTMDFASGCCVLIPSSVLKKVGLFDESYFLYFEDVDLSMRIRQAGYELYYCPEAVIWHKNAGSSGGSGSEHQQLYQKKNRLHFAMKYAPLRSKIAVLKQYFLN